MSNTQNNDTIQQNNEFDKQKHIKTYRETISRKRSQRTLLGNLVRAIQNSWQDYDERWDDRDEIQRF